MLSLPDDLTTARFLSRFWQRKPVLLRAAIDDPEGIITPNELATLACDDEIESRIIIHQESDQWTLEHGPFTAERFSELPDRDWTLLVQDVDKFVPRARELLRSFDFLPHWRLDDLMVSFAVDGGGVGPHLDGYDVFLCQASGKRNWRLGDPLKVEPDDRDDLPLNLVRPFATEQEWELEPGDVLYLPPGVPHWGTAVGECLTLSVGFRGPDRGELLQEALEQLLLKGSHTAPFHDPTLTPETCAGAIPRSAFSEAEQDIARALEALDLRSLLGQLFTRPKPQFIPEPPHDAPGTLTEDTTGAWSLHPWVRLAWLEPEHGRLSVFINGDTEVASATLAPTLQRLIRGQSIRAEDWPENPLDRSLLSSWIARGLLLSKDSDHD